MTRTTMSGRLNALGRAELTLLARNRTAVFVALLVPLAMIAAMKSTLEQIDLGGTGLTVAGAALSGGIGMVLMQVVYMNLVAAYVARREELVLKRLRTGEVTDREILAGTALPSAALALAQTVLVVLAGAVFFGLGAPERPGLLRFGRDMHDVLGRNLAVIALKSELAVELAQRGKPAAVDQMVEVMRIARASQQEVRDVVRGYREADPSTELVGARSVLRAAGIECSVEGHDGGPLPAPVQSALGWVVREAATNVLRHGDPRHCTIRLRASADAVVLDVENDGAPRAVAGPGGSGLAGLRERLHALDGSLGAGPAGNGLFRLTATIPLPRTDPALAPALQEELR
ncbi:sensor histidine kinase [Streptomyces sp. NPDC018000]|uniref:sensor histidine kinase n=1 Tax=Streptomyces sp. NPDC018000 TaxID=3365028 RepID=UPI003794171D